MSTSNTRFDLGRFSCRCFLFAVLSASVGWCGTTAIRSVGGIFARGPIAETFTLAAIPTVLILFFTVVPVSIVVGLLSGIAGIMSGESTKERIASAIGSLLNFAGVFLAFALIGEFLWR